MTSGFVLNVVVAHAVATLALLVATASIWVIRDRRMLRWWHVITRLFSVLLFGATLLGMLPRFKAFVISFGTELPGISVMAIQLSDLASRFFGPLLLIVPMALTGEMIFIESCLRRDEQVDFAKLCSFLVTGSIAMILLFCEFGAAMSLIKLANDLS